MGYLKKILSVGSCLLLSPAMATTNVNIKTAVLESAKEVILTSEYTKHTYRIQWATLGEMPTEGYPVLYLLDGDMNFPIAYIAAHTLMVNKIAKKNAPVLIVGIGYPNGQLLDLDKRAIDYTPPLRVESNQEMKDKHGGADQFYQFLAKELPLFLRQHTDINQKEQAIFGHSFGGLFITYSLFKTPRLFKYHFISSPSLWWDEKRIFDFTQGYKGVKEAYVRLTLGELEIPKEQTDMRRQQRNMWGNLEHLEQKLDEYQAQVDVKLYPEENHGSVSYKVLLDSLSVLQSQWQAGE